ncbi:hypothetical protein GCM10009836_10780 [Pseudonocardia ailaonensis]|uniref:Co/Zn/Cd efflux system component n=1 Tax=Pseudonocardia ailaonensis TaxID=367279 RepID=A0ABN2MQZ6_9PSEU
MRRGAVTLLALVAVAVLVVGGVVWWSNSRPEPKCVVTAAGRTVSLTLAQAEYAATIGGVGDAENMPDHAVTVAIATALQESRLANLPGGDRDSAGLFQQRPSQGWGTYAQVTDPVHASQAFYRALRKLPDWQDVTVTEAAQLVQRSAAPDAYAQWEPQARAIAVALTGEEPAALRCQDLTPRTPPDDVATVAAAELGTATLSGPQPAQHGWAYSAWLVAHAQRFDLASVTYDGRTWTADTGEWTTTGTSDGRLSLVRAPAR